MKTITEYQPLIFATLFEQPRKRRVRRRSAWKVAVVALPILYVLAGLKITADTGLMVWEWRFWLMFVPLFLLGERLLWALSLEGDRAGRPTVPSGGSVTEDL
jgi:hypothetical protein